VDTPRPWPRLQRGEERDFTILRIREDTFVDPRNGTPHPRVQMTAPDWVNVVALTPSGEALLVRQFRFGVLANTLEIPGGMVDAEETPAEAAARELLEETGYAAGQLVALGSVQPNPALLNNLCHTFLATGCSRRPSGMQDAGEDIQLVCVPKSQLRRLIVEGTIQHALVVAAVYFAESAGAL
jgi:ADP-ribose pyrophosphatase